MIPRILLVALLLAAAGLALPAVADQPDDESESAPVGQELSAAVQSTDAAASGEVSDGVFEARLERAAESEREAILQERADELDRRADRVERQLAELEAANGSTDPTADSATPANATPATVNDSFVAGARASAVLAQLAAMQRSVNVTDRRADDAGVDVPAVARVRQRNDELRGREAAGTARSVAFVPPGLRGDGPPSNAADDGQRGPPADVPGAGPGNQSAAGGGPPADTPAGGSDDPSNRGAGPGNGADDPPGNADGNGPPNDAGNAGGNGPSNGAGNAGGNGPSNGAGNAGGNGPSNGAGNADGADSDADPDDDGSPAAAGY